LALFRFAKVSRHSQQHTGAIIVDFFVGGPGTWTEGKRGRVWEICGRSKKLEEWTGQDN
jgi:hypothetical protein